MMHLKSMVMALCAIAALTFAPAYAAPNPVADDSHFPGASLPTRVAPPWLAPPKSSRAAIPPIFDIARPTAPTPPTGVDPLDEHWLSRFGLPVPDAGINVLLQLGDLLIAGGEFSRIGRLEARSLAAWSGTAWSLLGDFPGWRVVDLAPYPGGFVALGSGSTGPDVWRWTGSDWRSLGPFPGPANDPLDMAVVHDTVAVSVSEYAGGHWRSRIYLHDGVAWTALGDAFEGPVFAVAWFGGSLYAGGASGDYVTALVSRWDGASWQSIDGGMAKGASSWVEGLAVFDDELVASGSSLDVTDPAAPAPVVRWNGTTWRTLGIGGANVLGTRLRVIGGELYSYGAFNNGRHGIVHWDGSTWRIDEDSLQGLVCDVADYQGKFYAGGHLSIDGSRAAPPLAVRDGGQWHSPLDPATDMNGFLGSDGPAVMGLTAFDGAILAVGRFDFAGAPGGWQRCAGGARWDGLGWSPLGFETFDQPYVQNLAVHAGSVYAVGYFRKSAPYIYGTVARLENGEWQPVGGDHAAPFYNVYCLASALGDLFIGGSVEPGNAFRGIARWDGVEWTPVGGGVTSGAWISSIVALGPDVIVTGSFDEVGGVACHNIAAWNPVTGWRALGSGLDNAGIALLSRDGALYAGGWFAHAGGVPARGIACWLNSNWEAVVPLPGPYTPRISSLGSYRGRLVASGYGVPNQLASLEDDGTWHALGSGLDSPANAMVESGSSLFVGGYFSRAGASDAYGFAEWREDEAIGPPTLPGIAAAPNPFTSVVQLRYELTAGGRVRVEMFDLAGHQVDRVFDGVQIAGPQQVAWRPEAGRVRPGMYFARITTDGGSRVVRVVHMR
jgi:hypothetical protein